MRPLFDEVVCARLASDSDGLLTGRLEQLPPTGEARALILAEYATAEGLDLGESIAYADSASDLPLLECVGFPVAVNPEAKLATIARRRGWHTEHWASAGNGSRSLLPMGPLDNGASRWWERIDVSRRMDSVSYTHLDVYKRQERVGEADPVRLGRTVHDPEAVE